MDALQELARLLAEWNSITQRVATLIGRPASPGHIAEFVGASVFGIKLHTSASHKGSDGVFQEGSLRGRSVNIKWSSKRDNTLDLTPADPPDYYLVLRGPREPPQSSRGRHRPWVISSVYLFDARALHASMTARGAAIGTASSVLSSHWTAAEVFPRARNDLLQLTDQQRAALSLFAGA